jgi:hypothetical protein
MQAYAIGWHVSMVHTYFSGAYGKLCATHEVF